MKTLALCILALFVAVGSVAGQQPTDEELDQYIELVRMDVRQGRAELVGQAMSLSASQAATFWPLYEEYEQAFTMLGDTELQLIRAQHDERRVSIGRALPCQTLPADLSRQPGVS